MVNRTPAPRIAQAPALQRRRRRRRRRVVVAQQQQHVADAMQQILEIC